MTEGDISIRVITVTFLSVLDIYFSIHCKHSGILRYCIAVQKTN